MKPRSERGGRGFACIAPAARKLVQTTSLLRYPVFVNDKDYRGAPDMMKHPLLKKHLLDYFVSEVAELNNAIFLGVCTENLNLNIMVMKPAKDWV